jgi:hypothetical protein
VESFVWPWLELLDVNLLLAEWPVLKLLFLFFAITISFQILLFDKSVIFDATFDTLILIVLLLKRRILYKNLEII